MRLIASVMTIITGIIVIIAAGAVVYAVVKVRNLIAPIASVAKHWDFEKQELEAETTPKSVNSMTSIYLPRIQKDFPEFNYFEFKAKAENMMKSAFNAITTEDIEKLINASTDLKAQVNNIIASNRANHQRESYSSIDIHRTEIKNYTNREGTCVITLQTSVGYIHYISDLTGNIKEGSSEKMFQTRYDIDLMYIQDVTKVEKGESFAANNCPNCGAPLKALGVKNCPYCGSGVEGINIRTWTITKLTEC